MDPYKDLPPLSYDEFFKPTERCYRGMSILFGIYAVGAYSWLLIISQLTKAHLDNNDKNIPNPDHVHSNEQTMSKVLLWCGNAFAILAVLGLILM